MPGASFLSSKATRQMCSFRAQPHPACEAGGIVGRIAPTRAAGQSGFHKVCTMLKFDVLDGASTT